MEQSVDLPSGAGVSAPAQFVPSITVDDVIVALGAFMQPFVGAKTEIIRAQVNRVPPPQGAFVELTELMQVDLEYPRNWYDKTNFQRNMIGPKRIAIQADFYGEPSGDWCSTVKTAFRTPYGVAQFPEGIAPLYTDEGHEAPLMTGEQQYKRRWALTLNLQFNPIVVVPTQSADILKMNILENVAESESSFTVTDPFIGMQNPIGPPWQGFDSPIEKDGGVNLVSTAGAQFGVITYESATWSANQTSTATLKQLVQNEGYVAVVVRCDGDAQNFYYADLDASPGFGGIGRITPFNLQKYVNGMYFGAPLVQGNVTPQIGDVFSLKVIGSTLFGYQNGELIWSYTDPSPIASGSPGLLIQSANPLTANGDLAWSSWTGSGG
jgi:hypothetical protein